MAERCGVDCRWQRREGAAGRAGQEKAGGIEYTKEMEYNKGKKADGDAGERMKQADHRLL